MRPYYLFVIWYWAGASAIYNSSLEDNNTILIGFQSSFEYADGLAKLIAGAMTLAVERVNANSSLLPGYVLKFIPKDTKQPNSSQAISGMIELKNQGAMAFIGPDHCCACEALLASAWNLPMIAFNCPDPKVSDKKIYSTFARTLPTGSEVGKSVIALLEHFNWSTIVLLVTDDPSNRQIEEAILPLADAHNITVRPLHTKSEHNLKTQDLAKHIEKTYNSTRVYVLLANDYFLVEFLKAMKSSNLIAGGQYVIILVEDPHRNMNSNFETVVKVLKKYQVDPFLLKSVLIITPTPLSQHSDFVQTVRNYSTHPPFNIPFHPSIAVTVPRHASLLYDAVFLYARAATEVLKDGKSISDGREIFKRIQNTTYESILGFTERIDENGDAAGDYTLLAFNETSNAKLPMDPVGFFVCNQTKPSLRLTGNISWINGYVPLSEPPCGFNGEHCKREHSCGFNNEHCPSERDWSPFLYAICTLTIIGGVAFGFRHYRYERKLACMLWKIDSSDLMLLTPAAWQTVINSDEEEETIADSQEKLMPSKENNQMLGLYKGNTVCIKPIRKKHIDITRSLRKEMIQVREMNHENINPFIGACIDSSHVCIVSLYCARGSLKDILKNSDLNLDSTFIASLVADLIKGMIYIHQSEIVSHGNLKSSNCLVDSRWVLRLTDFGLHEFKEGRKLTITDKRRLLKGLLWKAPELLRAISPPLRGTQKGDVYSFAIVLHEILGRNGVWGPRTLTYKNVVEHVTMGPGMNHGQPFRPPITAEVQNRWPDSILRCLKECWQEDPARRPDFRSINVKLREMFSELKTNTSDNMLSIMEKYAFDLEGLVQERTHLLMEEKKKTETLLHRMLPKPVADQLKRGEKVEAESFDSVTIYFSDIIGFTALSAVSTPLQVVDLLNDLYTCFDSIIGAYDVYKVETIGDAYMVVSGLPVRNGDCHASEIAAMALHLLDAILHFEIRHRPGDRLKLRVGIHSGPCVAGVVGLKMPRYCLFGDTVNTASRMESTGESLKIHLSSSCKDILDRFGDFDLKERGVIQIKGKGEMRTYWLTGRSARFVSLSDDAKLRRHTDSRLEIRFSPRRHPSIRNPRLASGTRSWQSPLAMDNKSTIVSVSSCRNLYTKRSMKNYRLLPNISFTDSRVEQLKRDEMS